MTDEANAAARWDRVRDALHRALELDALRRTAYLDEVRGRDPALRVELESLLAASSSSDWLDTPAFAGDVAAAMLAEENAEAEAEAEIEPGRLIGHYRIVEKVGHGGMGTVFKAVDEKLGRTVALKVLTGGLLGGSAATDGERQRFIREARSASALNHPNIITIHEFDSDGGRDFIVMEYIEGRTLDQVLSDGVPLSTSLDYARQMAIALEKAHAAGIVHRDLKPRNVMVTKEGHVKVLDFGLAKRQHAEAVLTEQDETQTTQALTMAGGVMGTPAWMSPEQVLGQPLDERSDIFSFGIILYQIACGERPFTGATHQATMVQIAGQPHRPVRELNKSVPPALESLIERCLAKKREDRLPSMSAAAVELNAILAGTGFDAAGPRRHLAVGWIVAAGLLVAAAGGYFALSHRPPAVESAAARHSIRYALELQDAAGAASTVPVSTEFRGGAKFRLRLVASDAGFLYLIDEGPDERGANRLFVLSPRPGASAAVAGKEEKLTGWLVFDRNPGVEQFWVLWSRQPVALLEDAVRGSGKGRVDAGAAAAIRGLLEQARSPVNRAGNEVRAQGSGERYGSRIELRHE